MAKNPNPKLSKAAQERRRDIDNAKRRYRRQADRYEKDAQGLAGRDAEILSNAAQQLRARAEELNGVNVRKRLDNDTKALINDSKNYLVSNNRSEWMRGETLGKLRLSGTNLGHRFYALTESLWAGTPYTGPGDDRRLNKIRRALAQNPNVVEKYGSNPNANQMIEIISSISGVDMDSDSPYQLGDSQGRIMMRGVRSVLVNYG